jgi:hypothetical protein
MEGLELIAEAFKAFVARPLGETGPIISDEPG